MTSLASTTNTNLADELRPVQWPPLPVTRKYPTTLEEFVQQNGQRMQPSRADQEVAIARGRGDVWSFFFRITPDDIANLQRAEHAELARVQHEVERRYNLKRSQLEERRTMILDRKLTVEEQANDVMLQQRAEELTRIIDAQSLQPRKHGVRLLGIVLVLSIAWVLFGVSQTLSSGGTIQFGRVLGSLVGTFILVGAIGITVFIVINQTRASTERSERDSIRRTLANRQTDQQHIPRIEQALQVLETSYAEQKSIIASRLASMRDALTSITASLAPPPDEASILRQLRVDLEHERERYIRELSLDGRLTPIVHDDKPVANPLLFVSPAQLQDPNRIPTTYRPPQRHLFSLEQFASVMQSVQLMPRTRQEIVGAAQEQFMNLKQRVGGSGNDGLNLPPVELSDPIRHLLARRKITVDGRTHLLHGVYYVEYMFIAEAMLIQHGFFYDFVLGKTTGDRTTEVFFRDIVAIEKSLEDRDIPQSFDVEERIVITDAPALRLTLPSGDERSFTFADTAYLHAVGLATQAATLDLDPLHNAVTDANAALRLLSAKLREHKYLPVHE